MPDPTPIQNPIQSDSPTPATELRSGVLELPSPHGHIESPAEPNVDGAKANPEATPSPEPQAAPETPERKRWLQLAERDARSREVERKAKAERAAVEADRKRLQDEREAMEALLRDAPKSKEKAAEALKRMGFQSLEDLHRVILEMEPAQRPIESELAELKRQIQDREAAEKKARTEYEAAQRAEYQKAITQRDINKVSAFVDKAPEQYEAIRAYGAHQMVVDKAWSFLNEKGILPQSAEDEQLLITHFADLVEAELVEKLKSMPKLKKLSISTNTVEADKASTLKDTILKPQGVANPAISKDIRPSKFITNDTTVASRPITKRPHGLDSDLDARIDALVRAHELKGR